MKSKTGNRLIGIVIFLVATTVAFSQTDSQQRPPAVPFGDQAPNLSDVVKNVVVGQLKNVEKMKLTIAKPDGVEQTVAVDAKTKFVGDRGDAISLADFKTRDHVAAAGALKNGVFVAPQLAKIPAVPGIPPPPPPFQTELEVWQYFNRSERRSYAVSAVLDPHANPKAAITSEMNS